MTWAFNDKSTAENLKSLLMPGMSQPDLAKEAIISRGLVWLTPQEGIPARAGMQCQKAKCKLHYIDKDDVLVPYKTHLDKEVEDYVWNVSTSQVGGSSFIQSIDVLGKPTALLMSGSANVIAFELVGEDYPYSTEVPEMCEDREAPEEFRGLVIRTACGMARPVQHEDENGVVELVDESGILTGRDYRDLPGRRGIAVLMSDQADDSDYPSCYWAIIAVNMLRWRQVVHDQILEAKRFRIEREMHLVEDHCKLEDEYIEGIDCEEEDDYYAIESQVVGDP